MVRTRGSKIIVIALIAIVALIFGVKLIVGIENKEIDREVLEQNKEIINNECNSIFNDVDGSEVKYKKLLETETDPFKRGMYSSALVQVYTVKNDYKQIIKYGDEAVKNYNAVEGGVYYAIAEQEYLAWSMLSVERYSESFLAATQLLDMLNSSGKEVLTMDEIIDTESLIYSIFLCIYSDFEILDKAEFYYNKLIELGETNNPRVAYSKMVYASKINNLESLERYTNQYYDLNVELSEKYGTDTSDSVIGYLGILNIKLGNYEEAINQIKRSEEFNISTGYDKGIASNYVNYAEYYDVIGEDELAIEYYEKAVELYSDIEDYYRVKITMKSFISFLEENNIEKDLDKYYSYYYELSTKFGADKNINELLSQIVNINDELNNSTVVFLQKEVKEKQVNIIMASIVIIILGMMLTKGYFLVERKNETEKTLQRMANIDYLTEVNTRAYGTKLLLNEVNKNKQISVGIIDIDNFKKINDTYGHSFGDYILKSVANEIKESLNDGDIVYRFGGEEFVVAFIGKNAKEAKADLDKIRVSVNEILFKNNVRVSFSAGIEEVDEKNIDVVLKKADKLLYKAKKEGRNRIIAKE